MKSKTLFIISFVLCVYHSFAQRELSEEQKNKYLPHKKVKYKLSKQAFILNDTSIVSTNAVFVASEYLCGEKCDTSYTFMRFFNDGRVFISFVYLSYPSAEEFNDLSYGKYGRYIVKEGEVIVEVYMDKVWGVMCMFAKPLSTGIQFYALAGRPNAIFKNKNHGKSFYQKTYPKLYNY